MDDLNILENVKYYADSGIKIFPVKLNSKGNINKDKNGKITFSNIKANLLYTYFKGSHNFKVYPYTKLNNSLLNNYETYYNKYKGVLTKYTNIVEVE